MGVTRSQTARGAIVMHHMYGEMYSSEGWINEIGKDWQIIVYYRDIEFVAVAGVLLHQC